MKLNPAVLFSWSRDALAKGVTALKPIILDCK